GLLIIAGVGSVFLGNLRSYHTNQALSEVQASSRFAYEMLARDIRKAGNTGCNSLSGRVANVLNKNAAGKRQWWANWNNAVYGYDGSDDDPAVVEGTDSADRVAGTDSLVVLGTAGLALSVAEHHPT